MPRPSFLRRIRNWGKENRAEGITAVNQSLLDIYLRPRRTEIRGMNRGIRACLPAGEISKKHVTLRMLQELEKRGKVSEENVFPLMGSIIERDIRSAVYAANRAAGDKNSGRWKGVLRKYFERAEENDEILERLFRDDKHFTMTEIRNRFLGELKKREHDPLPGDERICNLIHDAWCKATQKARK